MLRRTKIVATLGPATDEVEELDRLIRNGLDVARVNFSHGSREATGMSAWDWWLLTTT